ncbi:DUF6087 family protein [Streptomyces blattellae]|uniref:DUF6087 family protein n=1 Tax=Streptomyces blattellae TaxID=2569855 RepID=UPI001E58A05E|nr:DUF6087 family protein [Streptomyces blattellae]
MGPEDEPLEEWAARRERRRAADRQVTGARRAVPLAPGPKASHVDPDGPRALLEWDGHMWATVGIAPNAGAAREFLGHAPQPEPECGPDAQASPPCLGPCRGRHRRPAPSADTRPPTPDTLSGAFTTSEPWAIQRAPYWNAF